MAKGIKINHINLFLYIRYLEDRRPAANMDPYMVTALLVDSTLLKGRYHD
jgi:glutamine synthetase